MTWLERKWPERRWLGLKKVWCPQGDNNFAAITNFNRTTTIDAANRKLVEWQRMVSKKMLSRDGRWRWNLSPSIDGMEEKGNG